MRSPRALIAFGLMLMLLGIVIPFLMVVRVLPSGFALNFFSAGASVAGMALGMIGVAFLLDGRRR